MKKVIFLLGALFFALSTQAQSKSAFSRLPTEANGYLILNQYDFPDVDHWSIEFLEPSDTDPKNLTVTIKRNVWGTNIDYYKRSTYTDGTIIHVIGFNGETVIVDQTTPMISGTPPDALCWNICEGPDYVYQLTNYDITPGGYNIRMDPPFNPPVGFDYFYEWFALTDFNSPTLGPQNPHAHGLNDFSTNGLNAQNHFIIYHTTLDHVYFHNRFGDPITGTLIGVKKDFGPYFEMSIESNELALDMCETFSDIQNPIKVVNENPTNVAHIACTNTGFHSEPADPMSVDFVECLDTWYEYLLDMDNPGIYNSDHTQYNIFFGMISFTVPCGETPSVPYDGTVSGGNGFNWPEAVANIQVSLADDLRGVTTYHRSDFYDEDSNFKGGELFLPEGFLQVTYLFSDGSRHDMYVNNAIKTDYSVSQADCIQYVAYPVPLTDNNFSLNLYATERVSFTHEIRDQYGKKIYSNDYSLEKNKEITDKVLLPENLPSGNYFNKFVFSDNSEVNFQIIK